MKNLIEIIRQLARKDNTITGDEINGYCPRCDRVQQFLKGTKHPQLYDCKVCHMTMDIDYLLDVKSQIGMQNYRTDKEVKK